VFAQNSTTTTTNYVYEGADTIEETDQNGNVLAKYARTMNVDEPLAESRSGVTSYYEADGLGSVTSLTGTAGAVVNSYTYDSFGKKIASSGSLTNPLQYAGREFDNESSLYYYRARYYDPTTGKFLSEDPLRFSGGMNFYAYVKNDPADLADPYGLKCTQVSPWTQVPNMSAPGPLQPYATSESGLFWIPIGWDFRWWRRHKQLHLSLDSEDASQKILPPEHQRRGVVPVHVRLRASKATRTENENDNQEVGDRRAGFADLAPSRKGR
jgi:RHS repeat-associated protein